MTGFCRTIIRWLTGGSLRLKHYFCAPVEPPLDLPLCKVIIYLANQKGDHFHGKNK
jgi:hypothetical protein